MLAEEEGEEKEKMGVGSDGPMPFPTTVASSAVSARACLGHLHFVGGRGRKSTRRSPRIGRRRAEQLPSCTLSLDKAQRSPVLAPGPSLSCIHSAAPPISS